MEVDAVERTRNPWSDVLKPEAVDGFGVPFLSPGNLRRCVYLNILYGTAHDRVLYCVTTRTVRSESCVEVRCGIGFLADGIR